VKRALEEPSRQIALNAGHEGAVVIGKIRDSKDENFGFNAETGEYGDMVKMGVIDPAKVTRLALQNAASIAGLMLTTEARSCCVAINSMCSPAVCFVCCANARCAERDRQSQEYHFPARRAARLYRSEHKR